jgi:hypothetical protein
MGTAKGNITLLNPKLEPGANTAATHQEVWLKGFLRNDTDFTFRGIEVELIPIGSDGQRLPNVCNFGSNCTFAIYDGPPVKPGESIPFGPRYNRIFLDVSNSKAVTSAIWRVRSIFFLVKYNIQPSQISDPQFEIVSAFSPAGIVFELRNKSADFIEVAWDQSVYIDECGNSSRLIRGSLALDEKDRAQPNAVVPPGAKLQETIFPLSHIESKGGKWKQQPLLTEEVLYEDGSSAPKTPAPDLTGKELRLYLRLLIGDLKRNVPITFKIAGMAQ